MDNSQAHPLAVSLQTVTQHKLSMVGGGEVCRGSAPSSSQLAFEAQPLASGRARSLFLRGSAVSGDGTKPGSRGRAAATEEYVTREVSAHCAHPLLWRPTPDRLKPQAGLSLCCVSSLVRALSEGGPKPKSCARGPASEADAMREDLVDMVSVFSAHFGEQAHNTHLDIVA